MKKNSINGRKASSEMLVIPSADTNQEAHGRRAVGRRSFLKGLGMAGATLLPASALLVTEGSAQRADLMASGGARKEKKNGGLTKGLTKGDAAILRFLAAAEILRISLRVYRARWHQPLSIACSKSKAIQLKPSMVETYEYRGVLLAKMGNKSDAQDLNTLKKLNPKLAGELAMRCSQVTWLRSWLASTRMMSR